jgi:hypothetical protein
MENEEVFNALTVLKFAVFEHMMRVDWFNLCHNFIKGTTNKLIDAK